VVHCEGGYIAEAKAYDHAGKWNGQKFAIQDGPDHMKNFILSIRAGKLVNPNLHVSHGHHAAALAHMANLSYRLGKELSPDEIKERLQGDKFATETFEDFTANLVANKIDPSMDKALVGPWLSFNSDTLKFEGEFADEANKLDAEEYRDGHKLAEIS
jgi:hypothetical protein